MIRNTPIKQSHDQKHIYKTQSHDQKHTLKSLGPIGRKFHGHSENDGFVFYEYIIKQFSSFCKYANISFMNKNVK